MRCVTLAYVSELSDFVTQSLAAVAVPADAGPMQAYMKTDMPFFGVKKPLRVPIAGEMKKRFKPKSQRQYEQGVRALWRLPHREEKYIALELARAWRPFINLESMGLYEQLVREGQWWDFVDDVTGRMISPVYLLEREAVSSIVESWVDDDDMWIRRAAILSHLKHKDQTDEAQLFDFCRRRMHEKEFFIRKAIGWILREYAKTKPKRVQAFLRKEKDNLSGLSYREASKHLSME